MKIRYTLRAARQFEAILSYIAERSPQGSDHVFDRIEVCSPCFANTPRIGRTINRPGFRRMIVNPYPYVILYQPLVDEIVVHDSRHASRRPLDR